MRTRSEHPHQRTGFPTAWLFPILLCAFASFFLLGDIGKWNDDYYFFGQFVPETGAVKSWTVHDVTHYWRPLYRVVATPLMIVLWDHDQLNHLVTAAVHGLGCFVLWRLMRALGVSARAAAVAAIIFMVNTSHFQAVFWNTCMFTALATILMLLAAMLYSARLRGQLDTSWLGGAWAGLAMGVLTFAAAAMNEQPAAAAAAFPVLAVPFLFRTWHRASARWALDWRSLSRAVAPLVFSALALGGYLAIHAAVTTKAAPGGMGSPVPISGMPERLRELGLEIVRTDLQLPSAGGKLGLGWEALHAHPAQAAAWGIALAIAAVFWIRWFAASRSEDLPAAAGLEQKSAQQAWTPGLRMLFGLAWMAACWGPIARIVYPANSRLFYAPDAGAAMALAGVIDWIAPRIRATNHLERRAGRTVWASIVAYGAIVSAVMMVGMQQCFRTRWLTDKSIGLQLRRAVPDPEPGTVFVPIRCEDHPLRKRSRLLDDSLHGVLYQDWGAGWFFLSVYHRGDVYVGLGPWGAHFPLRDANKEGFWFNRWITSPYPFKPDRNRLRWDKVVPFEIDEQGTVHLYSRVKIEQPEGPPIEVPLRQVDRASLKVPVPERMLIVPLTKPLKHKPPAPQ